MATNTPSQQEISWWDRAISKSEMISNGFEVFKAWLARLAEWVLFFCLIANIIEIFPLPKPFASVFGEIVLGTQVITLDVAGFGLASMGASAKRRGDIGAAKKATGMGWTLISIMMLTVGLVATSIIFPSTKPTVDTVQNALILVRIIVTVLYSHIVHSLRVSGVEHENHLKELEDSLSTAQHDLAAKSQEVNTVQMQLSTVQKQLSNGQAEVSKLQFDLSNEQAEVSNLRGHLNTAQQRMSTLEQEIETVQGGGSDLRRELLMARDEAKTLKARLEQKDQEMAAVSGDLSGVMTLRRDLATTRDEVETLKARLARKEQEMAEANGELSNVGALRRDLGSLRDQLDTKTQALTSVQTALTNKQAEVSKLQRELSSVQMALSNEQQRVSKSAGAPVSKSVDPVSNRQEKRSFGQERKVSNGQAEAPGGQEKIVDLNSRRKTELTEEEIKTRIRAMLIEDPALSGRGIARELDIAPGTALKYLADVQKEGKQEQVANG